MKKKKEICVFIPCYNCERFIEKTINSILNQTLQDFDIVVVDDGSRDDSYNIVKRMMEEDPRIILYKNEKNLGLGRTRNLMFDYCKDYKYVALMDADDLAPDYRLEMEYNYLEKNGDITCVSGVMQMIDENDNLGRIIDLGVHKFEEIKFILTFKDPIPNGASMIRMSDLLANDLRYRNHFFCAQDYMFYCELVNKCKMVILPYILLYYRWHGENISITSLKRKKERDKLLDEVHDFTFSNYDVKLNWFEKKVFKRGFRDTEETSFLFKIVFHIKLYLFKKRYPMYRGLFK